LQDVIDVLPEEIAADGSGDNGDHAHKSDKLPNASFRLSRQSYFPFFKSGRPQNKHFGMVNGGFLKIAQRCYKTKKIGGFLTAPELVYILT